VRGLPPYDVQANQFLATFLILSKKTIFITDCNACYFNFILAL